MRPITEAEASAETAQPRRAHPLPAGARFLHVVSAQEGAAAWAEALVAAVALARALNRTLVAPCVRDGALVSCGVGRVAAVSDGSDPAHLALARSGVEPDGNATSRLEGGQCVFTHPENGWTRARTVLPLHAYYDAAYLTTVLGMVRWEDWVAHRVEVNADAAAAPRLRLDGDGRVVTGAVAVMGCGAQYSGCGNDGRDGGATFRCDRTVGADPSPVAGTFVFGGFVFAGHTCLPGRSYVEDPQGIERAAAAQGGAPDVYVVQWRKHPPAKFQRAREAPLLPSDALWPFNPLHYAAARHWVAHTVRGGGAASGDDNRYAVLQWRAQHLPGVARCADAMVSAVTALPGLDADSRRLVFVGDLPGERNVCGVWDTQLAGEEGEGVSNYWSRVAVGQQFTLGGFAKYDQQHHWELDGGILAVRDLILAAEATWYLTCTREYRYGGIETGGAVCDACSSDSLYVAEALLLRQFANRSVVLRFDGLSAHNFRDPPLPPLRHWWGWALPILFGVGGGG